jgi:peptide/nickel transport system substrate-binding protein
MREGKGSHLLCSWLCCGLLLSCGGSDQEAGQGAGPGQVPRERTLILGLNQMQDYDAFNPFIPGVVSSTGSNFLFEPLYYYNAFSEENNLIPWIAESHQYNEDYSEVTIKIRDGVKWSDGMPWTAADVVFTINMLKANAPELILSTDMKTWVKEAVVVDPLTARIVLTAPNPRFLFSYFTDCFVNGVRIVPEHIWKDKDAKTFKNLDLAKGWPVVSGPYKLAASMPEQRVWDLRKDWWAVAVGFQSLPKVERIIYLPFGNEAKWVQQLLSNEIDSSVDLRPVNIKSVLDQNPKISTWTGREPPYGYLDWWPLSLGFNNLEAPFDDPEIRWAVNYAINRQQVIDVGWQGAGKFTLHPYPEYPPLMRYIDEIEDLFDKYQLNTYDPSRSAEIMQRKGWQKDEGGFWSKEGERFKMVVDVFPNLFQDFTPVLIEQLRQAGFEASFRATNDAYTRMTQGTARAFVMGHAASVRDPYFTLRLYHSRFVQPTGTAAEYFWRWRNPEFDTIVDRMAGVSPDDPELVELFRQAMDIWMAELPSIPLVQWYHRIPHNETYWENWPTAENPYVNSAYWHRTWLLVLLNLQPAQ